MRKYYYNFREYLFLFKYKLKLDAMRENNSNLECDIIKIIIKLEYKILKNIWYIYVKR